MIDTGFFMDKFMKITLKTLRKAYDSLVDEDKRTYAGFISFCDHFVVPVDKLDKIDKNFFKEPAPERNDNDAINALTSIFMRDKFKDAFMLKSLVHTEALKLSFFKKQFKNDKDRKKYVTVLLDKMIDDGTLIKTMRKHPTNGLDVIEYRLVK